MMRRTRPPVCRRRRLTAIALDGRRSRAPVRSPGSGVGVGRGLLPGTREGPPQAALCLPGWLRPWSGACRRATRLCFLLRAPPSLCESHPVPLEKGPGIWEQGPPDDRLNLIACRGPFPMRSHPRAWVWDSASLGGAQFNSGQVPSSLPPAPVSPPGSHPTPITSPSLLPLWVAAGGPGSRLRRERAGALSGSPEGVAYGGQAGAQDSAGGAIQRDPPQGRPQTPRQGLWRWVTLRAVLGVTSTRCLLSREGVRRGPAPSLEDATPRGWIRGLPASSPPGVRGTGLCGHRALWRCVAEPRQAERWC